MCPQQEVRLACLLRQLQQLLCQFACGLQFSAIHV
jgi:hypothetical protein